MRPSRGHACLFWTTLLASLSASAAAQQVPSLSPVQRQWLGCWELRMQDSVTPFHPRMLVRLDSMLVRPRERDSLYHGQGLAGFAGSSGQGLIGWVPKSDHDSVEIIAIGVGGLGWRLARSGDSLLGQAYEYFDAVPDERPRGPVTAHRERCPS